MQKKQLRHLRLIKLSLQFRQRKHLLRHNPFASTVLFQANNLADSKGSFHDLILGFIGTTSTGRPSMLTLHILCTSAEHQLKISCFGRIHRNTPFFLGSVPATQRTLAATPDMPKHKICMFFPASAPYCQAGGQLDRDRSRAAAASLSGFPFKSQIKLRVDSVPVISFFIYAGGSHP